VSSTKLGWCQLPKSEPFLECFSAGPGRKIAYCDYASAEMHVSALASLDPNMLKLYGREANPNHDIYLFNAANIPFWKDEVRTYYDLDNPNKERIDQAKHDLKHIRNICKPTTLAHQYGASHFRMFNELTLLGIDVTEQDCQVIKQTLDNTYPGVVAFGKRLKAEWVSNGGWFLNGYGRPMVVHYSYSKDILNRYIQSTAHDLLTFYIRLLNPEMRRIGGWPFFVDTHDDTQWSIPADAGEEAARIMHATFDKLNEQLDAPVLFKGDVKIADNLAQIKCGD